MHGGGNVEFAVLADVDNDGRALEIVAQQNGTPQAWFEVRGGAWVKHVVSDRTYGHGIGVGDVNGDKRNDILTPRGWLEAPADPRTGPWTYHAAWESINAPPAPAPTGQPVAAPPSSSATATRPSARGGARLHARARRQRRWPQRHRHGSRSRLRRVLVRAGRRRQVDAPFDRQRLVARPCVDAGRSQSRRPPGSRHRQALHGAQRHRSGRTRAARRVLVRVPAAPAVIDRETRARRRRWNGSGT